LINDTGLAGGSGNQVNDILMQLSEREARELLMMLGQASVLRDFERELAIRYAVSLLESKNSRSVIRDRLCVRYQVSRRTAYRIIENALCQPR
jgi:hypothetical protein